MPLARLYTPLIVVLLWGCGSRTEYRASNLDFARDSWDSALVGVTFARHRVLGGSSPVDADSVVVTIFDERYDTLYSGPVGLIPVNDARLGNQERMTLEACGDVKSRHICVQEVLRASPKRLTVEAEIDYPIGNGFADGSFELIFGAERQRFDESGWERIEAPGVKGHLVAWVDHAEGKERGSITIPFTGSRGNFNLSRHSNFRHFKYYLESNLLDKETAVVHFDVFAGWGSKPVHLASVTSEIHQKTEGERADEVRYLVQEALEKIIDELGSYLGVRGAVAFVEEWSYSRSSRSYRVLMEAEWEGPRFDRGQYEIEGILEVREDGSNANFRFRSGNRRTEARWRDRTPSEVLQLGKLEVLRRPRGN